MSSIFNINNLSVKLKIYVMGGVLVGALAVSVIYALHSMNRIGVELVAIAEQDIPLTKIITNITTHQLEQALVFERVLRFATTMQKDTSVEKPFKQAVEKFLAHSHKVDEAIKAGEALVQKSMAQTHSDEDKKEFKHVYKILQRIEKEHGEYADHAGQVFVLASEAKMEAAFELANKVEREQHGVIHELETLLAEIEKFTAAAAKKAEYDEQTAFVLLIIIAGVAAMLGTIIALLIIRGITYGLSRAVTTAERIASGDLTEQVHSTRGDEIGVLLSALGMMRDKLHAMIQAMNQASTELAASSEELSLVSNDSNRALHKQQSEIEQVATAMNEMSATVHEVAKSAQHTSEATSDASQEAIQGQQIVKSTVESIEWLAEVVGRTTTVIQQVGQDSDNIGIVLDVIKGIAEQTNLLALNAAIEAARAGEQGRGFAVVADEVRTLAQRTQKSTTEIQEMITRLQDSSKNAVGAMQTGRERAASSVEYAVKAGASLVSITEVVRRIRDMNAQIASAVEEQSSVAEDVNRNISAISEVSEQNAAATNQITASSEELARMATNLQTMIAQFQV